MTTIFTICLVILPVEYFLRIPFIDRSKKLLSISHKSLRVVSSKRISDHWKEKVLLRYALDLSINLVIVTGMLLGCLPLVLIPAFVFDLFLHPVPKSVESLSSPVVLIGMTLFSIAYVFLRKKLRHPDYNFGDRLLHRMALSSSLVGEASLGLDPTFARKNLDITDQRHIFVSGLARAGTTILLRALYQTGEFRSLTYRDMPFVLMPNLWKKLSGSFYKETKLSERAHGDGILVDYDSPEAFEEIFWRTISGKEYIGKTSLFLHNVDMENIERFRSYVSQVVSSADGRVDRYLSKNNNNILRLGAIRKAFPNALILIPFRNPLQHANSLLRQHEKFCHKHAADPFALNYMNWLGHYEFGLNHKRMVFEQVDSEYISDYQTDDLNYWLRLWVDAYDHLKDNAPDGSFFICFEDVCAAPSETLRPIYQEARLPLDEPEINSQYNPLNFREVVKTDDDLTGRALDIYETLRSMHRDS